MPYRVPTGLKYSVQPLKYSLVEYQESTYLLSRKSLDIKCHWEWAWLTTYLTYINFDSRVKAGGDMPDPKFSPGPDQPEHQTKQTNSDIQVNRVYSICSSGRILVRYIIDEYSINEKYILYYSIQCYKNFSCIFSLNLEFMRSNSTAFLGQY